MKSVLFVFLIIFSLHGIAQDQPLQDKKNPKCLKFTSFSISAQPLFTSINETGFSDLQRIMPKDDPLFQPNLSGYAQTYQNNPLFNFSMKLGMSAKSNQELMLGISYVSGSRNTNDFYKGKIKHLDTLFVEDYIFYVDSNYFSSYTFAEHTKEIGLDVSYLFRSDQSRMISAFVGIGLNAGFAFYSDVTVRYSHDSSKNIYTKPLFDPYTPFYYPYGDDLNYNEVEESVKTDPSILFRGYVPVGFNWNLAKKNAFWKHINFVFSGNFGLEYRYIVHDKGYLKPFIGITVFGLRYTF